MLVPAQKFISGHAGDIKAISVLQKTELQRHTANLPDHNKYLSSNSYRKIKVARKFKRVIFVFLSGTPEVYLTSEPIHTTSSHTSFISYTRATTLFTATCQTGSINWWMPNSSFFFPPKLLLLIHTCSLTQSAAQPYARQSNREYAATSECTWERQDTEMSSHGHSA